MGGAPFLEDDGRMSDNEWSDLRWCGEPPVLAAEAMDEWIAMLRQCDPWNEMRLDDVPGEFRAVFKELLDAGDGLNPAARAKRLRQVSRRHGAYRRRQGCPAFVFRKEIAFAEQAIAIVLVRNGAAPMIVMTIQSSYVPVMQAIVRATYSGYVDWAERSDGPSDGPSDEPSDERGMC